MKKSKSIKYVAIPLLVLSLCFSLCSCGKPDKIDEPYICYYPLDWGMSVEKCAELLKIDINSLRSAKGKSPCGLPSTAYMGSARIFDYQSDITLWFTAFENNGPEGLSSIIIANPFVPGKKALPGIEEIFDMYQADITVKTVPDNHEQISIPFTSISVTWNASPFESFSDKEFIDSWDKLLAEKSEREDKDVVTSLTEATLKYLQEDSKYRLDIRGEPAAYYNYLKSKKSK